MHMYISEILHNYKFNTPAQDVTQQHVYACLYNMCRSTDNVIFSVVNPINVMGISENMYAVWENTYVYMYMYNIYVCVCIWLLLYMIYDNVAFNESTNFDKYLTVRCYIVGRISTTHQYRFISICICIYTWSIYTKYVDLKYA